MNINPTAIGSYHKQLIVKDDLYLNGKQKFEINTEELTSINPSVDFIVSAHKELQENGYSFVGYHGTNQSGLRSIITNGFDPRKIGENAGAVKGDGFYVAGTYSHAKDFAEVSTNDGDINPKTFQQPKKEGEQGIERVLRVYIKNSKSINLGKDAGWGLTPSAGDHNNDAKIKHGLKYDEAGYSKDTSEMVISPNKFNDMVAIPSLGEAGDKNFLNCMGVRWPNHTV
jgi:hypothetical protein